MLRIPTVGRVADKQRPGVARIHARLRGDQPVLTAGFRQVVQSAARLASNRLSLARLAERLAEITNTTTLAVCAGTLKREANPGQCLAARAGLGALALAGGFRGGLVGLGRGILAVRGRGRGLRPGRALGGAR